MRKIIQLLLNTYGGHLNSEVNMLVTEWYHQEFHLFDMTIGLHDVPEDSAVKVLESTISDYCLTFDEVKQVQLIPALSKNGCDVQLKVVVTPELVSKKLAGVVSVNFGFWDEGDIVTIGNANEHIDINNGKKHGKIAGLFVNGTVVSSGETFSFYYNKIELDALFRSVKKQLNGVEILDQDVLSSIVAKTIFYRMIDSDIGFHIEMDSPDVYRMVKQMVWHFDGHQEAQAATTDVFSTRGYKIGVAFQRFNIKDIKQAELSQKSKPYLTVVVNNDEHFDKEDARNSEFEEEVATEWGMY